MSGRWEWLPRLMPCHRLLAAVCLVHIVHIAPALFPTLHARLGS